MNLLTYRFLAQTPIWTGSVAEIKPGSRDKIDNVRLESTNLLGSIRWWFEVLVRGLGGYACNPGSKQKSCLCPDTDIKNKKQPNDSGHHCVVCELFGCTDWARKFRFQVLDENGDPQTSPIEQVKVFSFQFIEIRPIAPKEKALLELTLKIISDYGAIGGRTVLKPSDEPDRKDKDHHLDYGIIKPMNENELTAYKNFSQQDLENYVSKESQWRKPYDNNFKWASLKKFLVRWW